MNSQKKLVVSHAPFWHDGSGVPERNYNMIIAALPAVAMALVNFGAPALGVISLAISSAIGWELLFNRLTKKPYTAGNWQAALIGLLLAMLLPASVPWWFVVTGTFVAVVIGLHIFGGIGSNPFHPVALSLAILMVSWKDHLDFNEALVNFKFGFAATDPLATLKHFGPEAIQDLNPLDLFLGQQVGGLGATCGLALVIGGLYLIMRGYIRWEISVSFLGSLFVTATLFNMYDPLTYANPVFHLVTGYTLIGAFFLATEDSSSPVNFVPMLIYGAIAGIMTVLIRNIGAYIDGVIFAILLANLVNPLLDKIRPKAIGKVV